MKKTILILLVSLSLTSILISGCRAGAEIVAASCDTHAQKVVTTATAWSQDITNKTKCEAYRQALIDFTTSTCFATYGTAANRKGFQDDLKAMKCD